MLRALACDYDLTYLGICGMVASVARPRWETSFPLMWLISELAVRSWHRPFWDFHYLHLAIPISWLSVIAISTLCGSEIDNRSELATPFAASRTKLALISIAIACVLVNVPLRVTNEIKSIKTNINKSSDENRWLIVQAMRNNAKGTHLVFADDPLFAFYARIPVPLEITVLSRKRILERDVTQAELFNILIYYRPEQVLFSRGAFESRIIQYVTTHYSLALDRGGSQLYLINRSEK